MAAGPIGEACGSQATAATGPSLLGIAAASGAQIVRRLYAKRPRSELRWRDVLVLRERIWRWPIAGVGARSETVLAGAAIGAMLSALATATTALILSHVERASIVALRDSTEPQLAAKEQVAALARDRVSIGRPFSRPSASDTLTKLGAYVPSDARFVAIEQDARGATTIELVANDPDSVVDALRADPASKGFVQSRLWTDNLGRLHLVFQRAPE